MGRTIAILLALTLLSGCSERDPEEVAEEFVGTLLAYRSGPSTSRLERVWSLLDDDSRAPFEQQAAAASEALGVRVEPRTMLRFEGLARGDRAVRFETVAVDGDRARVTVELAWATPTGSGGPEKRPAAAELTLARSEDGWKVALPLIGRAQTPADAGPPTLRPSAPASPGGGAEGGPSPDRTAP